MTIQAVQRPRTMTFTVAVHHCAAVNDHLTKVDPNMGMIVTMRTVARLETFFLQIAFWVSLVLGGLALLLTVSGLFSVLSYLVEQRTRRSACGWRSARRLRK